ncbi:MAG: hypothetical protein JWP64_2354, partial [Pseudonocardia sp.]|nr:hypothetical protein [Pseudonocardia sp.]
AGPAATDPGPAATPRPAPIIPIAGTITTAGS